MTNDSFKKIAPATALGRRRMIMAQALVMPMFRQPIPQSPYEIEAEQTRREKRAQNPYPRISATNELVASTEEGQKLYRVVPGNGQIVRIDTARRWMLQAERQKKRKNPGAFE